MKIKSTFETRSPRDLGISNQKLINLKILSNLKCIRSYSPLFEDQKLTKLLQKQKQTGKDLMRTRTFNISLKCRKVKDDKINSMMITDLAVLREPKFGQALLLAIVDVLTHNIAELSAKLFRTNEISWPHFLKWL